MTTTGSSPGEPRPLGASDDPSEAPAAVPTGTTDQAGRAAEEAAAHEGAALAAGAPPDGPAATVLASPGAPLSRRAPFVLGFLGGLGALSAWFLGHLLMSIGSTLMLVVVAFFLAAGLDPSVDALQRKGLRRPHAVLVVVLVALVAIALFVFALAPVIGDQVASLTRRAPGWFEQLQANTWVRQVDQDYGVVDKIREYVTGGDFVTTLFGGALGIGLAVLGALLNAFIVLVLMLYFLSSLDTTTHALYQLAPASRRPRVAALGDRIVAGIGGYVAGAFVVALCAGVSSLVFLLVAGLAQYAVALAFVVALLDVIPMIGATIGAVVVSAIGFATDVKIGLACVVFYVVYQQVENYLIYPRVMRRSVDVPGAVTVLAALIGTALLGVVGALLAIPTAAAILMLVREVWVRAQDER